METIIYAVIMKWSDGKKETRRYTFAQLQEFFAKTTDEELSLRDSIEIIVGVN